MRGRGRLIQHLMLNRTNYKIYKIQLSILSQYQPRPTCLNPKPYPLRPYAPMRLPQTPGLFLRRRWRIRTGVRAACDCSYLWPSMARQLPHPQWPFPFSLLVSPACPPVCRPRMCCACVHVLLAPALGRSKSNVGYGRAPLGRLISNTTHRPKCNCLCWTAGLSGWSLTPAGLGGLASMGGALWLFGVLC